MKAWQLLRDPERWNKGAAARDQNGKPCSYDNPSASSWCVLGALMMLYGPRGWASRLVKTEILVGCWVPKWQDAPERTHAEVLAALKKADV